MVGSTACLHSLIYLTSLMSGFAGSFIVIIVIVVLCCVVYHFGFYS